MSHTHVPDKCKHHKRLTFITSLQILRSIYHKQRSSCSLASRTGISRTRMRVNEIRFIFITFMSFHLQRKIKNNRYSSHTRQFGGNHSFFPHRTDTTTRVFLQLKKLSCERGGGQGGKWKRNVL